MDSGLTAIIAGAIGGSIGLLGSHFANQAAARRVKAEFKRNFLKDKLQRLRVAYGIVNQVFLSALHSEVPTISVADGFSQIRDSTWEFPKEISEKLAFGFTCEPGEWPLTELSDLMQAHLDEIENKILQC